MGNGESVLKLHGLAFHLLYHVADVLFNGAIAEFLEILGGLPRRERAAPFTAESDVGSFP
jgi:hypothetical protein